MNKDDVTRLAAALNQLRPDWGAPELRTFIWRNLAARPITDVAMALVLVALDPVTRTPARVLEAGPWWQATRPTASETGAPQPPHIASADTCRVCRKTRAGHDHLAELTGDQHPFTANTQTDKPSPDQIHNHVAAVKAALHQGDPNHD